MEIYVDGSHRAQTGKFTQYGGIGVYSDSEAIPDISETILVNGTDHLTFEITAVLRALQHSLSQEKITIFTDSLFVIEHLTHNKLLINLKTYKKSNGKQPVNFEIIAQCLEIMSERNEKGFETNIKYVKGHSGIKGNSEADKLAGSASKKFIEKQ